MFSETFETGSSFIPASALSCGSYGTQSENRILQSEEAEAPWPWSARIGETYKGVKMHYCGATVISDRYLVTAEHCFSHIKTMDPDASKSALSETYITLSDWKSDKQNSFEVIPEKIFFRPDRYKPGTTRENDFAPDLAVLQVFRWLQVLQ